MIRAESLTRTFDKGRVTAVDNLNFRVSKGEIYGIVGPDGAGKSTLLRILAAILTPTKGTVQIEGTDIFKNAFVTKEKLAYMPQRFGLYEELTVEENIFFFGRLFGLSRKAIAERSKMLYRFSRLEPFKKRYAGKLSGGMKQKLGLACCLVHSPGLVILDEPTNGVDPVSRREFWKILYDLLSEKVTIVISTSYLDEAERCNRVALMHKGKFIREGRPEDIKKNTSGKMIEIVTDKPKEADTLLRKRKYFEGVILTGNSLRLFSGDPDRELENIRDIFSKNGLAVLSAGPRRPTLEDCFINIIARGGDTP